MASDEMISPSLAQAEAFLDDGHIDQALAVYHALIAAGGEDKMTALFGVASCYARRKQWEEAEEVLNQVIQQIPTFAEAFAYRGAVRLDLGHVDESIADLDQAVAINPTSAVVYLKQAEVYLRLGLLPLAHTAVRTAARLTAPDIVTRDYIRTFALTIDKEMKRSISRYVPPFDLGWLRHLPWSRRAQPAIASSVKTGVES
jgi:pentatricopeptide repeat protein